MQEHFSQGTESSQEGWQRLLPIVIFGLAVAARLIPGPRTIDDAYITFRYARNILAGNGFVYNPGERVLGTTTPLFTLILVIFGFLTGGEKAPFPILALLLNALADGITCLIILRLGKRIGFRLAGISAALTWAIAPFSVTFAIGGLETSLYVMLLVGCVAAYIHRQFVWMAGLSALALLTRPDALILIGPMMLDRLWLFFREAKSGKAIGTSLLYEGLVFLLPTLAWTIFACSYFGSPFPHSIAAKSLAYRLAPEAGLVRLLQHYGTPFMETSTFGVGWIGIGFVLYLFLYLLGGLQAWRCEKRIWPFILYPWLYFIIFAAANPLIFRWYLTPPLPAYFLFILTGAEALFRQVLSRLTHLQEAQTGSHASLSSPLHIQWSGTSFTPKVTFASVAFFLILAPLVLSLRGWTLHPDHGLSSPAPEMAWYKLELLYRQVADGLADEISQYHQAPVLAAGDVGVLGYFTAARILDTVGLNSTVSAKYYPLDASLYIINYAIPPELILDQMPDYLVILEVYGRAGLLKDARFYQAYKLLQKTPSDIYGSDGLLVFKRNNPP